MPTAQMPQKELIPAGNHIGRVYQVIHIGVIDGEYKGTPNQLDKIRIGFELPLKTKVFKEGEPAKPLVISGEYTLSMGKKSNLRPIVEGIIGHALMDKEAFAFDINDLIGYVCMVNITHETSQSGTEYQKIKSTAPLPEGIEAPAAFNPVFILDYKENWSDEKFEKLPEFIKDKMKSSYNYQRKNVAAEPFESRVELTPVSEMGFDAKEEFPEELNPADIPF